MKTKLAFSALILLLCTFTSVKAQDTIDVIQTQAQMSKGMQPCYSVDIMRGAMKSVEVNWVKKLQENIKVKVQETGPEFILNKVVKEEITHDTITIYSLLIQSPDKITIHAFFEIDSVFFGPKDDHSDLAHKKINTNIIHYMRTFAVEQYRMVVANELKEQEKVLKTMEGDLKKLEKEEENMKKENSSLENDIEEREREIKEEEANIDMVNQELLKHNASMLTLTLETDKDAAKDRQKELEKQKKDYEKSRSKARDDISSYESKIEKNNKAIEDSETQQAAKAEEIAQQEEVIRQVQAKLDGIK
jgi:hypothetical protein